MAIDVEITFLSGSRKDEIEHFRTLPLFFGRADTCQVRFDATKERKVSGLHAELRKGDDGELLVVDLESRNGVLLNGVKVEGKAPVPNHAVLELGAGGPKMRLKFEDGGGFSFAKVRATQKLDRRDANLAALASTDESLPAYSPEELGLAPKGPDLIKARAAELAGNRALMLGVFVIVTVVGLGLLAVAIFSK